MVDIPVCLRSPCMGLMRGSQPQQPVFLSATNFGTSCWVSPPASRIAFRSKLAFTTSSPPPLSPIPVPYPCPPLLSLSPAPIPVPRSYRYPPPAVTPPLPSPLSPPKRRKNGTLVRGIDVPNLKQRPDCHADNSACRYIGTCGLANPAAQAPGTRHPAAAPAFIPSQSGSPETWHPTPGAIGTPAAVSRQITTYPPNRIHQEKT